jgi:Zn-finger nucleic acid-binding protein
MKCPADGAELVMTERSGVEIDYCPQCRGVWLDRGELDKIIDRNAEAAAPARAAPAQAAPRRYDDDGYHPKPHRKKRVGFLGELFDF